MNGKTVLVHLTFQGENRGLMIPPALWNEIGEAAKSSFTTRFAIIRLALARHGNSNGHAIAQYLDEVNSPREGE